MVASVLARWFVLTVVVPLAAAVIRWWSHRMEQQRGGPTEVTRLLHRTADALHGEWPRSAGHAAHGR
ncbi:hypothetical protein ACNTMW_23860 [Planosporangium sp. 12N6]|uniref:hypothetical protein n=1 Tax=Planosporangium spinosum TaxID=3402278 RepID=UPI003CF3A579